MEKTKIKRTKEVIEATPHPEMEHVLVKYLGKEAEDITDYQKSTGSGAIHSSKRFEIELANENKLYTHIHTHPTITPKFKGAEAKEYKKQGLGKKELNRLMNINALPANYDLRTFIVDGNIKKMVIAVRDSDTGEVRGYQIIKKTKSTPQFGTSGQDFDKHPFRTFLNIINANYFAWGKKHTELLNDVNEYNDKLVSALKSDDYSKLPNAFDAFTSKYHLQHKILSAKNYHPNESKSSFVKRENKSLDSRLAAASIIGLLGAIFFLSPNLTGFAIANLAPKTLNMIGIIFFVIGLIGAVYYFRKGGKIQNKI
ncbi:MAG: DUF308 domain-containing protein [Candidatus Nanoarchaeia archaeon]|nr:DUF308 domain-containing protein [Candidatus Nanoarchaeia archaeon]MDD5741478.1 DUF308 domain-containing protein [Candidatus Nanoarchaeia archaeon]